MFMAEAVAAYRADGYVSMCRHGVSMASTMYPCMYHYHHGHCHCHCNAAMQPWAALGGVLMS